MTPGRWTTGLSCERDIVLNLEKNPERMLPSPTF